MLYDQIFIYAVAVGVPMVCIPFLIQLCGWWRFFRIRKSRKSTVAATTTTATTTTTTTVTGDGDAPDYNHIAFDNNDYDNADLPPYSTATAMDTLRTPPPPIPPIVSNQATPTSTPAYVSRS